MASISIALLIFLTPTPGFLGGLVSLAAPVAVLFIGWRWIPRFWRTLGGSLVAGALAGIVVLGPAMRIVMRLVAIAEPTQSPEFSIGGTVGIVVVIGAMFGAIIGVGLVFAQKGLELARFWVSVISGGALIGALAIIPDIRAELFELGLGAGMNIPLFGLAGFAYGWVDQAVFTKFRFARTEPASSAEAMA